MSEAGKKRLHMARTVFRVASGNFLEMYDFMVFGYFSAAIGRAYFPAASEFASLMFALTTFAVGFLVRPLGAIFLGAYIDHIGRRKGLLVTLALMSVGTLTIALVPGYQTIGLFAPILVVLRRLCRGSAGVELGGVSVYLSRSRRATRILRVPQSGASRSRWPSPLLGFTLSAWLPPEALAAGVGGSR
jgi:MFS family permease